MSNAPIHPVDPPSTNSAAGLPCNKCGATKPAATPTPLDFLRYPDLRIRAATPLPKLLAGEPPLAQASNVPEIAAAFRRLAAVVPRADASLAALCRFEAISQNSQLHLLLNLLIKASAEQAQIHLNSSTNPEAAA